MLNVHDESRPRMPWSAVLMFDCLCSLDHAAQQQCQLSYPNVASKTYPDIPRRKHIPPPPPPRSWEQVRISGCSRPRQPPTRSRGSRRHLPRCRRCGSGYRRRGGGGGWREGVLRLQGFRIRVLSLESFLKSRVWLQKFLKFCFGGGGGGVGKAYNPHGTCSVFLTFTIGCSLPRHPQQGPYKQLLTKRIRFCQDFEPSSLVLAQVRPEVAQCTGHMFKNSAECCFGCFVTL